MKRRDFFSKIGVSIALFATQTKGIELGAWHLGHHGDFSFKAYGEHLYIMHGINSGKDVDAHCFIHNVAFIEAKHGLILIDPGASYYVGIEVMKQIERVSSKPIISIVNTHHHSDHWFANGAIKEKYPNVKIYGHPMFESAVEKQYFNKYNIKENHKKAKIIALPTHFLTHGETLEIDGEIFYISHPTHAHTNTDIALYHKQSNVLFLGDLALESTLGYFVAYSSILENIDFLEKIDKKANIGLYVPGHGESGNFDKVVKPYLFYLKTIRDEVKKAYIEEKTIFELSVCKKRILEIFGWEDDFNFPLRYLENHMEFIYLEFEKLDEI